MRKLLRTKVNSSHKMLIVGNMNLSFIIDSHYGRSYPGTGTLRVTSDNQLTMFQSYAGIHDCTLLQNSLQFP